MSNSTNHVQEATAYSESFFSDAATVAPSPSSSAFTLGAQSTESPAIIPPEHHYRTLVLCFDGTGDQFDSDNSNIVEFFTMLKKDDCDQQMVYYQAGIGTYTSPEVATPLAAKISKTLDEAIAWNLAAHVMDGYEFLMQNYKAGDRICIFGFSRGAYTARGLAGMIHKVGLLPACNHQQVPFAYKMYSRADETGWKQSNAFKKAFSVDVPIEFIGVWDTVNSVGLIPRRLPFTTSNTIVRTFRHAVALDERRAKFKANLWNRPNNKEATLGIKGQKPQVLPADGTTSKRRKPEKQKTLRALEKKYSGQAEHPTDVEEVWFAGCHCDVGGGSVDNDTPHSLARIALRWMVRECFKTSTGIMFTSDGIRTAGLDPFSLHPIVQQRPPPLPVTSAHIQTIPSRSAASFSLQHTPLRNYAHAQVDDDALVQITEKTEEEHELLDALSPIYDQLDLVWWFWWVLEVVPMKQRFQKGDNSWDAYFGMNMGRGRFIPKQRRSTIRVHRSVKMRMEARYADGGRYVPKASFETALECGNVLWVD